MPSIDEMRRQADNMTPGQRKQMLKGLKRLHRKTHWLKRALMGKP